ncbi:LEAF RUST 10 DISEASE-RESISTANCE LOCUS RECEPTOR-LIKE PROTEIN KINASE-like 1.2 [Vicia villosa]|uniref:LEAF RUST 10 DISEASE-RESISTANCE LOCUS RECEPTOR-LIKE PROTEIN KINASE-like 1.2 n=1 Tax=Vicia villosa TaxID=3911 RepID=UPI00273B2CF9|nr:LEAF RUST 10 DISEASE-RESISTANCE LOCUS RECEPTOR-LIKE PROTEIN KINASE-like 1.2 [Vicia villosa]
MAHRRAKLLFLLCALCYALNSFAAKSYYYILQVSKSAGNQQGKCSWKNDTHIEKHAKSSCYYGICPDGSFDYFSNCSLHKILQNNNVNSSSLLQLIFAGKQNLTRKLVIAFAVIIAIYFYKRKSYVQSRSLSSELTSKDLESGSQHLSFGVNTYHFSYSELEEATNNFDPSKVLGKGAFGTVYYGKLNDGRSVAVKKLLEKNNDKRVEQFKNEVEIMASLVHENLVSLYGCTSLHSRELLLVYEYVSNGTVADHLRGKEAKHGKLTWPIRMNIAVETAKALEYLHTSKIIHRDIKTNNILYVCG